MVAVTLVLVLAAAGCGDDGAADAPPTTVAADTSSGDGVDDCGQGQAWPDDPDFREAVCRPYAAILDLIGGDVSGVPAWTERITAAILSYDDDRDGAIRELDAVTAEIRAAAG